MCGFVVCPTCRGEKFTQIDQFGASKPIAAFDLIAAQSRGVHTHRCWSCDGEGVVTQIQSDYVIMEKMRSDLLIHRILSR